MKATFFGGAMNITDSPEYIQSINIGAYLATRGFVVKNGGYRGMMEAVSMGASEIDGSNIIGYTVKTFPSTKGNKYLTETVITDDIYDRLKNLIEGSDIYIFQVGGIGTLSELFLTLDVNRKEKIKPPIILFGCKFWEEMISKKLHESILKTYDDFYIIDDIQDLDIIIDHTIDNKFKKIF